MNLTNLNNFYLAKLLLRVLVFLAVIVNVHAAEIDLNRILPMDKKITYGKLDNGVTYTGVNKLFNVTVSGSVSSSLNNIPILPSSP